MNFSLFLDVIWFATSIMLVVAFVTYLERKILALFQLRKGPNVCGWNGILQPVADCIKLLNKQILFPNKADKILFVIAPLIPIIFQMMTFCLLPIFNKTPLFESEYSLLIIMVFSLIASFGECLSGLTVDSVYQKLGSCRAIIQVFSYELCFCLCLLNIALADNSFDISVIANKQEIWNIFKLPHIFIIYICVTLAMCNRTPFDTLEAEQELIAGYHTEYSSILFCLFYISEYTNLCLVSFIGAILFLGGIDTISNSYLIGSMVLLVKTFVILISMIFVRAALPRFRFYNILRGFWFYLIPILFLSVIVYAL